MLSHFFLQKENKSEENIKLLNTKIGLIQDGAKKKNVCVNENDQPILVSILFFFYKNRRIYNFISIG